MTDITVSKKIGEIFALAELSGQLAQIIEGLVHVEDDHNFTAENVETLKRARRLVTEVAISLEVRCEQIAEDLKR